jgi:putative tryptophan/tyrosine transport system substrate-binding protein
MKNITKYIAAVLLLFSICMLCPCSGFSAKQVAVVISSRHEMYEKIYEQYKQSSQLKDTVIKKFILEENQATNTTLSDAIKGGGFDAAFSIGTEATKLLKDIGTIPTVFSIVVNPKYFGFLGKDETSLDNLTGISIEVPVEDQFSLLKKIIPAVKRVGVIYDPSKSGYTIARAIKCAPSLNIEVFEVPVKSSLEVPNALTKLEGKIDSLLAIVDDTVYQSSTMGHILLRCLKAKIPVFGFSHKITAAGAIFSTYIDFDGIPEVAAERTRMILDGTPCKDIPFKFTSKWKYSLNMNVAKTLGLEIPNGIMVNADKIVSE